MILYRTRRQCHKATVHPFNHHKNKTVSTGKFQLMSEKFPYYNHRYITYITLVFNYSFIAVYFFMRSPKY